MMVADSSEGFPLSLKMFFVGVLLFLVGMFYGCNEIRYMTGSVVAEADALEIFEERQGRKRRAGPVTMLKVAFTTDEDAFKEMAVRVPDDFSIPSGGKVQVQYFPGKASTTLRMKKTSVSGLLLILLGLGAAGVGGFLMYNEPAQ